MSSSLGCRYTMRRAIRYSGGLAIKIATFTCPPVTADAPFPVATIPSFHSRGEATGISKRLNPFQVLNEKRIEQSPTAAVKKEHETEKQSFIRDQEQDSADVLPVTADHVPEDAKVPHAVHQVLWQLGKIQQLSLTLDT
uniref:Uncharacterized protein n=1 Tax=Oryza brachyantha TaxID=4533 RepID=J3L7C0_ORYBR